MENNTENTALLVMDMEVGILDKMQDSKVIIGSIAKAISHARKNKIPVIYVTVGFRQGAPEIAMINKSFSAGKDRYSKINMDDFMKVHPDLAPLQGEITVIKRRISAFTGSDLEVILRAFGIKHLILTGISTSGVVLSTLREAADKDYRLTVLSDCCADQDEEIQRVLTTKIFTRQADVISLEEWKKNISNPE